LRRLSLQLAITLGRGDTATVTVTVDGGEPPTALTTPPRFAQDSGPNLIDVLSNDTDPDGGPKLIDLVTQPGGGTVMIAPGGAALTYAPHTGYCNSLPGMGLDNLSYTLNGGSTAAVSIVVTCQATGVAGDSVAKAKQSAKKCKQKSRKAKAKCKKKNKKLRGQA
jgi:hypothetical protein